MRAILSILILFSTMDGIVRFNTYQLYNSGTLYQELLECCRRILVPHQVLEGNDGE